MDEESLFAAALEKSDPAERRAFLEGACPPASHQWGRANIRSLRCLAVPPLQVVIAICAIPIG